MAPAAPVLQEARHGGQLGSFAHVLELRVSTNAAPQKILQHMQRGGMPVEVNGRLLMICTSTLSNLTVIERSTAETVKECQLRLLRTTRASATFRQQIRLVCTDGCAANILCEKHVAAARRDACSAVHVLCDVHRTSLVHGKMFSLLDDNVRGMLRCALSLRHGAALLRFRRCVKDEFASRLQIIPLATACRGRDISESSSQIVCDALEKSRCPQGAAGSLPERRLAGAAGPVLRGSAPGAPTGPQLRPHPLDLWLVGCALVLAPWVVPSTQMDRVRPRHGGPGHYRSVSLLSEHRIPTLRAPRPWPLQV